MRPEPLSQTEKNVLWSKIENGIESGQKQYSYFQQPSILFGLSRKFALTSFLIFALLGGSIATVIAADSAKPGDTLFPIDIAAEKIQLMFSFGKKKSSLRIKFAEERLSEVKIILALIGSDDYDEDDTTATSTIDQTTTSTDPATTTEDEDKKIKKFDLKSVAGANTALTIALEYLEQTKSNLEEKGNGPTMLAVDEIIEELTELAEDHVSDLDKFKVKIKDNGNKLKIDIKTSSDKLKTKFKFNQQNGDENEDEGKKVTICHIPPGNPYNAHTIKIGKPAAQAHLAHGDTLGACGDEDGDGDATSTPDTIAPVISNLVSSAATTTAEINWDTDEASDSKVWYSTTTPLIISTTTSLVSSTTLVTSHNVSLLNLFASTTYYFIVVSADEAGNSATSTESSFTTLEEEIQEPVDTTPPVLSDIMATSTTATSTNITWLTDEEANSNVWYNTVSPLVVATSTTVASSTDLIIDHEISLTDLTASTTYYYLVTSADVAGNTATSSESSFITLPE